MARSNEPFIWSLFATGGALSAMLVPIHILILGLAAPLGWLNLDHDMLRAVVTHPLGKLYLFVLISLPLFHWAHRFRFTLVDLGLKALHGPIAFCCYTTAIAGTVWCGLTVWNL